MCVEDRAHIASAAEWLFIYANFVLTLRSVLITLKAAIIMLWFICILKVSIILFVSTVNLLVRSMLACSKRAKFGWLEARFFFF